MTAPPHLRPVSGARRVARDFLIALGAGVLGWMGWAVVSWARYGHDSHLSAAGAGVQNFLPDYEVQELFQAQVEAPAPLTLATAQAMGLDESPVIRTIFRVRELMLGGVASTPLPTGGVVEQMRAMGWGVLRSTPQREIILGAVTQPWNRDVVFRALPPDQFAAFHEPQFVKIVVTIAATPVDSGTSTLQIGTYATTTDPHARARFRRYWAVFSPGILLIRAIVLSAVKHEAERRARSRP
ncbi:MAG: hypothetical protein ABI889_00790 [Gemmatimonadota bacterium]